MSANNWSNDVNLNRNLTVIARNLNSLRICTTDTLEMHKDWITWAIIIKKNQARIQPFDTEFNSVQRGMNDYRGKLKKCLNVVLI